MSSYLELSKFIDHHKIARDSVGTCRFAAYVDYESTLRNITTDTKITIISHSVKDGNVELQEQLGMQPEDYHLDLSAKWQDYKFIKENGKLEISGSSPKMGGDYVVTIIPKM